MPSFMNQLTKFAKSPQGKKLVDKAQQIANDPKTKEQVDKAKLKFAEMREGAAAKGNGAAKSGDGPNAAGGPTQPKPDDTTPTATPPAA